MNSARNSAQVAKTDRLSPTGNGILSGNKMTTENGFEFTTSTGNCPQDKMATLTYINLNYYHSKKVNTLLGLIAEKMERECGVYEGQIYNKLVASKRDPITATKYGFVLLHDGKELLCAAYCQFLRVVTLWTPPKQRRKGYAGLLLRMLNEYLLAVKTSVVPMFVCAAPHTFSIHKKNGWEMDERVLTEGGEGDLSTANGERNWYPSWMGPRLAVAQLLEEKKASDQFKADLMASFRDDWLNWLDAYGGAKDLSLKVKV